MSEFEGAGNPLTSASVAEVRERLHVNEVAIWTVIKVETSGCGFLVNRRPQILFERHIFHYETNGRFDLTHPQISDADPGGYGAGGVHQYDRLAEALACDRRAALRSASWGIGQVLGRNAELVGFADVESMVREMMASEGAQLLAMQGYIVATGLDQALRDGRWADFARGYNGKNYAANAYDTKLHDAFQHYTLNGVPDIGLRAAQLKLMYAGCNPGPVDGLQGVRTRQATERFQQREGLPVTGNLDAPTLARLGLGQ
jgi:hypothetical protein